MADTNTTLHEHLLDQLWVSPLTTAHHKMKFLCLKTALIYGSKYLEGSWTAYAFSETAIEGILSLLESTISPTMSFQLGVQD